MTWFRASLTICTFLLGTCPSTPISLPTFSIACFCTTITVDHLQILDARGLGYGLQIVDAEGVFNVGHVCTTAANRPCIVLTSIAVVSRQLFVPRTSPNNALMRCRIVKLITEHGCVI